MLAAEELMGIGLYTPAEAALYARVSTQLMTRWLWGSSISTSVLHPQLESEDDDRVVTFLDFVQTLAVRAIRVDYGVSLSKIRQAVQVASTTYHVPFPFAMKHKTFLFGDELIIKLDGDDYAQISGEHARHRVIKNVVELYMRDLTFDEKKIAKSYEAFAWRTGSVVMDPAVRFGEPLVTSCGYSALALWESAKSEGGLEAAAEACGVKPEEVELACRYFDHLRGKSAA